MIQPQPIQHDILFIHKTYRKNEISVFNQGGGEWETRISDESVQTRSMNIPDRFRYQNFETLYGEVTEVIYVEEMGDALVVRSGPKMAFLKDLPSGLLKQFKKAEAAVRQALADFTSAQASTHQHQDTMRTTKEQFDSIEQKCFKNNVDEALEFFREETQSDDSTKYDEYGVRIQDPSPYRRKNQITVNSRNTPPRQSRNRNRSRSRSRSRERQRRRRRTPSREREELRDRRRGRRHHRSTRFPEHGRRSEPRPRRTTARVTDPRGMTGEDSSDAPSRGSVESRLPSRAYEMNDHLMAGNLSASTRAIDASENTVNATGDRLVDVGVRVVSNVVSNLVNQIGQGNDALNENVSRALDTQDLGTGVMESFLEHEN